MADPAYYNNATDLSTVKLNLNLTTISKYDTNITQWGLEGNREIDDLLFEHSAVLPLTDDQYTSAKYAVFEYIAIEFYTFTKDFDSVAQATKEYEKAKEALISKLDAQPEINTQSQSVAVSTSYRSYEISNRGTLN